MHTDEFPGCCQIQIIHHFYRYGGYGESIDYTHDYVYEYVKTVIEGSSYSGMYVAVTNSSQKEARKALKNLGFKTMKGFKSTWDSKEKVYFHYYRTR